MILNNTTNISTAIIDKISINVTAILNNTANISPAIIDKISINITAISNGNVILIIATNNI